MLRCDGDSVFEPYVEPQTISVGSNIPTFRGTTIIETNGTISATYKRQEV